MKHLYNRIGRFMMVAGILSAGYGLSAQLPDISPGGLAEEKEGLTSKELSYLTKKVQDRNIVIKMPQGADTMGFRLKSGPLPGCGFDLNWKGGGKTQINVAPEGSKFRIAADQKKKRPESEFYLSDQRLKISGFWKNNSILSYVRPNVEERYSLDDQNRLSNTWDSLEPASEHFTDFEIRQDKSGVELWIDGRYTGRMENVQLDSMTMSRPKDAEIKDIRTASGKRSEKFVRLDTSHISKYGTLKDAAVSLGKGVQEISGIPFVVNDGKNSADIGVVRMTRATFLLECDAYLSRSPLDGMPEALHYSVPVKYYTRAWVLCAAENDDSKIPILTARITRFMWLCGRSADSIADTAVMLPKEGEKLPENIRRVGEVSYDKNGKQVKMPLYLVEMTLDSGRILDLLASAEPDYRTPLFVSGKTPYLDFELLGKTIDRNIRTRAPYPDSSARSSVHVFGVTLEESPFVMQLKQVQEGNIFHNDEKPELGVVVTKNGQEEKSFVSWEIKDVDGKTCKKGSSEISFGGAQKEQTVNVDLAMDDVGWYSIDFELKNASGRQLLRHEASFALLGKDTRRPGDYNSTPYSSRFPTITSAKDFRTYCNIYKKWGIRRSTWPQNVSEADLAEWKLTLVQIPNLGPHIAKIADDREAEKKAEELIGEFVKRFPHVNSALIFHESYGTGEGLPPEFSGKAGNAFSSEPEKGEHEKLLLRSALILAKVYKEKFPQIRVVIGNSGDSIGVMALLFRNKFPKEYIGAMGEENLGQTIMPEKFFYWGTQAAWYLQELARKMGYGDMAVDACNEWKGRLSTDLGAKTKAEWRIRDCLISYAYGSKNIQMTDFGEPGTTFYNNEWGSQAALRHYPLLYPKPAFVADATFTKVLDGVTFKRIVPSGSKTVYLLEFERWDKKHVYVPWTVRDAVELALDFGNDTGLSLIDLYGRKRQAKTVSGKMTTVAGTAPSYIISDSALRSAVAGKRIVSADEMPSAGAFVANRADNISEWQIPDKRKINGISYEVGEVSDQEKGKCLEFKFTPDSGLSDFARCSAVIKLKNPVEVPAGVNTLGLWVKGNSSWGDAGWEFTDAEGEVFVAASGDYSDWPGNMSVNFDGWSFVRLPLTNQAKWEHNLYPDWVKNSWNRWLDGNKGKNKKIDFPIRLSGVKVEFRHKTLVLNHLEDSDRVIRIKDITAY